MKSKPSRRVALATAISLPSIIALDPAAAQTAPPQPPVESQATAPEGGTSGLGEIVVTAQRRSENLQRVPISVTAITGPQLAISGITSTDNLAIATPGLVINRQVRAAVFYLRGVGTQATQAGIESPVAVYVDGVYYATAGGLIFALNNVERIETLKGPQGTLFGRNATGGVVNVITRTPSADTHVEGGFSYGNYDDKVGSLYATGGNDKIKADIALRYERNDGYGRSLFDGSHVNQTYEYGGRAKLLWTPGETTKITLAGDYIKDHSTLGISRSIVKGSLATGRVSLVGSVYDTQANFSPHTDNDSYTGSIHIEQELADNLSISSLTAYHDQHLLSEFDIDGTAADFLESINYETTRTLQQEILLVGSADRLNYTAGFFYLDADSGYFPAPTRSRLIPSQNFDRKADQKSESYAVFGQGTYRVFDATKITVGLRYTIDRRNFVGSTVAAAGNPLPLGTVTTSNTGRKIFRKLTWRLSLDQQVTDNVLAYVSYNRGFKSGTFNTALITQAPVNPEVLDAYEAGVKTEFFDRTLRFNAAVFHYDYKDIQLTKLEGTAGVLFNAASGKINGYEAQVEFAPHIATGNLLFNVGLAGLPKATYSSFPNGPRSVPLPAGGNVTVAADLSGNRMVRAPKLTINLGATYSVDVPIGELSFNANYYHTSRYFWESDNRLFQRPYSIVNGQVGLKFGQNKAFGVNVFGKNLTNAKYATYSNAGSFADQFAAAPPRTYGVGLQFSF